MIGETIAVTGGLIVPVQGEPVDGGTLLFEEGEITDVLAPGTAPPAGACLIDAHGKWVLPGLVDAHTHLGVQEEAEGWAGQDGNERTGPVMAHVRALDAINPADMGFRDAIMGGVLTVGVTPGSANPVGGQFAVVRCWGRTVNEMVLKAPAGMKSALGENPRHTSEVSRGNPRTRLGIAAAIRSAFTGALNYRAGLAGPESPGRDLGAEVLLMVLDREIPLRQHCHRADDIATALRLAREFGYELVIEHGTEAYLLAGQIAGAGVRVVAGPLLTARMKPEVRNRSLAAPGRLAAAGVTIALTTDHPVVPVDFLVHQATLAVKEGLDRDTALRAITITPAEILGCADVTGTLEPGKSADIVIWSGDPLDFASRAERAFIAGREIYRYDYGTGQGVFL
jgi:imidazolonepropionase-like amidohydrolase